MATKIPKDAYGHDYPLADALAEVGPGWAKLVTKCYNACAENGVDISQIKEKFGGLRFYVCSAPVHVFDIIDTAEDESYSVCEQCGKPGQPRTDRGWIKTLCSDCEGKHGNQETKA